MVLDVESGTIVGAAGGDVLRHRIATPGSTVKPFVLELALQEHRIAPDLTLACRRRLEIGGKRMDCSHADVMGSYNAVEALALSCNSYFAAVGARLQAGELERHFRELGFNHATGLLSGESEGRITEAHTVEQRELLALGAEGIEVTPLELANAYLRLARAAEKAAPVQKPVFEGLRRSADSGFAQMARPQGLSIAAKTGTSSDRGSAHTHAWLVGYAPAENPRIVVLVFLENGRGSSDAALAARTIFQAYADASR